MNFLKNSLFLNRTTRLAPQVEPNEQHELIEPQRDSGRLMLANSKPATIEDVHLLCKILHQHLENSTAAKSTAAKTTTAAPHSTTDGSLEVESPTVTTMATIATITTKTKATTTTTTSTTSEPSSESRLLVGDARDLDPIKHRDHLLESVFAYESSRVNETNGELAGQKLMAALFQAAATKRRPSDYETDDETTTTSGPNNSGEHLSEHASPLVSLRVVGQPKQSQRNHLHLVYWLLERLPSGGGGGKSRAHKLRVLSLAEANELMEQLEHSQIKRHLEAANLKPLEPLVSAYNWTRWRSSGGQDVDDNSPHSHSQTAHTIDDTLESEESPAANSGGGARPAGGAQSGLSLLLDRLASRSFTENLHLYLIIFLLALLLVILCFAVPMICFKSHQEPHKQLHQKQQQQQQRRRRPLGRGATSGERSLTTISGSGQLKGNETPRDGAAEAQKVSDAIWRKLSNSTSTLTKDQTRVLHSDATFDVEQQQQQQPRGQFEWYSFEDRLEQLERMRPAEGQAQSSRYIISDQRKVTKSIQTQPELEREFMLEFKGRQESRSSDTLTKSELVLMKEKLVPIAQQEQRHQRQAASQTSLEQVVCEPIYVNQPTQAGYEPPDRSHGRKSPTKFIDHSVSSAGSGGALEVENVDEYRERRPKMRHFELEPRARSRVEAIRAELARVEQRDRRSAGVSPALGDSGTSGSLMSPKRAEESVEL